MIHLGFFIIVCTQKDGRKYEIKTEMAKVFDHILQEVRLFRTRHKTYKAGNICTFKLFQLQSLFIQWNTKNMVFQTE